MRSYSVPELVAVILKYQNAVINGRQVDYPIHRGDLIAWSEETSQVPKEMVEYLLDRYFEYVVLPTGTLYRVTGILTKFLS